jgi:alpha-beta hydrolase superfamily lysophospholipase
MLRNARGYWLFGRHFASAQSSSSSSRATVFVLHGWAEHMLRHEPLISDLTAAGYDVYALDHQGHGLSDGDIAFDLSDVVDDAAAFIKRYQDKSKKTIVIGMFLLFNDL